MARWFPIYLLAGTLLPGCHRDSIPAAELTVRRYAAAIEAGDPDLVYELMSEESKQTYGRTGAERLLKDARPELRRQAKALDADATRVTARARVSFVDGEQAELVLEDGKFRVAKTSALPARPRTVTEALTALRRALSQRSYPLMLLLLTAETQNAMERDLSSLVEGLEHPESLRIEIEGDRATVEVPGGHVVRLRQKAGLWKIEDFL